MRWRNPALQKAAAKIYTEAKHPKSGVLGPIRKRKPDGKYPPPPLNGSGHAWHHSRAMLHEMIRTGSRPGEGDMPAWQGKLTGDEIDAVISWFQSLWPDQVYAEWYEMQERGNE